MKKLVLMIVCLACTCTVFSQSNVPFSSTSVVVNNQEVRMETYDSNYCYLKNQENNVIVIGYEYGGYPIYKMPSRFCEKYSSWTPGELIAKSGKLKNNALTVGIVTCLTSSTLVGCAFLTRNPTPMCVIGGVVGFGGGIATIVLLATSNRLLQEAGLKMQRMQISANGLTIKF